MVQTVFMLLLSVNVFRYQTAWQQSLDVHIQGALLPTHQLSLRLYWCGRA